METNTRSPSGSDQAPLQSGASVGSEMAPLAIPTAPKKTLTGFARIWAIFWLVANLGATCAPANRVTDPRLGGLALLVMVFSAVTATGYILLYYRKPAGLLMILIANILGMFLNFVQVTGYEINVTTGLIMGIITYFVTRKQVPYPFGKSPV